LGVIISSVFIVIANINLLTLSSIYEKGQAGSKEQADEANNCISVNIASRALFYKSRLFAEYDSKAK